MNSDRPYDIDYISLVREGMDAFWICDIKECIILDTNEAYCGMTGYDKSEVVGKSVADFDAYTDIEKLKELAQNIKIHKKINLQTAHRAKNGALVFLDINAVYKEIGEEGCIAALMRNVTQKVNNEQGYRNLQELFMQFADNVDDVFWVRDQNRILFVNQAYEKIWGRDKQELYTDQATFTNAVVEEDRARIHAAFISELYDGSHVFNEIFRICAKNGEVRWIHARSFPIYDSDGYYIRSTGIAKDITAQKKLALELQYINTQLAEIVKLETHKRMEKELAFSSIFEMMGSGVCITNALGIVLDVNRQFLSLFECDSGESIIGKHFCNLFHIDMHEKAVKTFDGIVTEALNGYQNTTRDVPYKWHITTTNNSSLTVLANVACFNNYKKEFNIIISMIDITAMRELEKKQKESEKLLMSQSKLAAMGEMIGAIAHQWRQPLNLLGLMIQDVPFIYKNNELDQGYIQKFTDDSMVQINLMSKTIDDFRNFFKSDKKQVVFSLGSQVKNSLSLVETMFKSYGIDMIFLEYENVSVLGYPNELTQAVLNIVTNAKDAFESLKGNNKRIVATVRKDGNYGEITIKDNAGGIAPHLLGRIFEPYFTTKPPDKGTGIGLYMSKSIVESNMGGTLNVCNDGEGAVFTIKIPLENKLSETD